MALGADASAATSPTWLLIITLVLGNGTFLGLLVTGFINRRKTASEATRLDADADVASSTATEALVRTSLSLLQPYTEGLTRFSDEAARLREENEALKRQQAELHDQNEMLADDCEKLRRDQDALRLENAQLAREIAVLRKRLGGLNDEVRRVEGL